MWEVKETSPAGDIKIGHVTAGTTPTQLINDNTPLVRGLLLRCPGPGDLVPNTDIVFVGKKNVTCSGLPGTATDGLPIIPGGAATLAVDDASQIYIISQSANQDVCYVAQ